MITTADFKEYRSKLGFTNKNDLKGYLSAKDIKAEIDYTYIQKLNQRVKQIIIKINETVNQSIRCDNIAAFLKNNVDKIFEELKGHNILPRLNNQGRRPEQVFFAWLRGAVISNYFTKAISKIFQVNEGKIETIGHDKIDDLDNFSRQPTADLEIRLENKVVRLEMQSGYQGINDIKEHKVREARFQFQKLGVHSIVMHIDLFNGQVAFVDISQIADNDVNWITRQQMEGQTVFNIDQNYFIWRLLDEPPKLTDIQEGIFN